MTRFESPLVRATAGTTTVLAMRRTALPLAQLRLRLDRTAGDSAAVRAVAAAGLLDLDVEGRSLRVALASLGATAGARIDADGVVLSVALPADDLDAVVACVATALSAPALPDAAVSAAASAVIARATAAAALPENQARRHLLRHRYGDSPYARAEVEAADVDDLVRAAAAIWPATAGARTAVVVGAVDAEPVADIVARRLASAAAAAPIVEGAATDARWKAVVRAGSAQTCVRAAGPLPAPGFAGRAAAAMLVHLLGGSPASLLYRELRDAHGWSYHPAASVVDWRDDSRVELEVDVATDSSEPAARVVRDLLRRLREEPVADSELAATREGLYGEWARRIDGQASIADALLADASVAADPRAALEQVTAADLSAAARAALGAERLWGVAVGESAAAGSVATILSG